MHDMDNTMSISPFAESQGLTSAKPVLCLVEALRKVILEDVAHTMMLEQQAIRPFQISLNELLKTVLKLENEKEMSLGHRMKKDPNVW
eukprot:symbB.v1.2.006291.t1/scaffold375.1/size220138/9